MFYITGDTHRDFKMVAAFCNTVDSAKDDVLVILGDAGINYFGGERDYTLKRLLATLPITLFYIHGNHEQRPEALGYEETQWNGGTVYWEPEFPTLLFAKDGDIYDLDGKRCIVIDGAYSVDKPFRIAEGWGWWPDEQPSAEIKARVEHRLDAENWCVDVVLSHTCPLKYEPREVFLSGISQASVDKATEQWLDAIEERLRYSRWYCVLRNTKNSPDGLCDVMVKADDAPKISRLVERFKFGTVDKAKIESEIVAAKEDKAKSAEPEVSDAGAEPEAPDVNDTEKLVDDLLGTPEGKAEPEKPEPERVEPVKTEPVKAEVKADKEVADTHPFSRSDPKTPPPSEPISESSSKSERADILSKPSVKEQLREIAAAKKAKESDAPKPDDRSAADKPKKDNPTTTHKQPQNKGKSKSKKSKGSR